MTRKKVPVKPGGLAEQYRRRAAAAEAQQRQAAPATPARDAPPAPALRSWEELQRDAGQLAAGDAPPIPPARAGAPAAHDRPEPLPEWQPFPNDTLPAPLADYTTAVAAAIGCDTSFIALPLLAAAGAAIGNTRVIQLSDTWKEPAAIWAGIIGVSGTQKSPAIYHATCFTEAHQQQAFAAHHPDPDDEEDDSSPPRFLVSDTTVEALAVRLQDNSRGLLLCRDELAGWLQSFDQYRKGQGADLQHYLTMHHAGPLLVDRKTGDKKTIYVPRAFLCVTGGIQPGTLARLLSQTFFEAGLPARLLLTMPPRRKRQWPTAALARRKAAKMEQLFAALWALRPAAQEGGYQPVVLPLTPAGLEAWKDFFNRHAEEQYRRQGDLAALYSKLEGACARLALIIHCCRAAAADPALKDTWGVDETAIAPAARLVRWFGNEAERIYATLDQTHADNDSAKLARWAARRQPFTASEHSQAFRRNYPSAEDSTRFLDTLARAGALHAIDQAPASTGGRPTRKYRLPAQPNN